MKENKGITLVALVVTIILLIILAGISIRLVLGENGIVNKAKIGAKNYEEQEAKEKLELVLGEIQVKKAIEEKYGEIEEIDKAIRNQGMTVLEDIIIVDRWQFQIDKSVPKIVGFLGEGKENSEIKIISEVMYASDYTSATYSFKIEYEGEIESVQINGKTIELNEERQYIEENLLENGNYTVVIKDKNNGCKIQTIKVDDISEDMDIYHIEDLEKFRSRVNKGATYENKCIRLMNDIDLSSKYYQVDGTIQNDKSWEPIGTYYDGVNNENHYFGGTFDGRYHKIKNLYIVSNQYMEVGFFTNLQGTIKNLILENAVIKNSYDGNGYQYTGAIIGLNNGTITNCSVVNGENNRSSVTNLEIPIGGNVAVRWNCRRKQWRNNGML